MIKTVIQAFLDKYGVRFQLNDDGIAELEKDLENIESQMFMANIMRRNFGNQGNQIFGNDVYGQFWVNAQCPDCDTYNWVGTGSTVMDHSAHEPDGFKCRNCGSEHTWNNDYIKSLTQGHDKGYIEDGADAPYGLIPEGEDARAERMEDRRLAREEAAERYREYTEDGGMFGLGKLRGNKDEDD